ncbi:ATP-binding protein [Candidatus Micrarchaeota archaeon]|nr:ATP-binding protein [Candidatus Micrarchaeota archaeon]
MKFIDREAEMRSLKDIEMLSKKKLFVIALYGLRRVGKTRLLLEFLKARGVYFFVNKNKTSADLLNEYQEILRQNKILGELEALDSWDRFFDVLMKRDMPPVVFDEFQNFGFVEPGIFGIMQKNIDLHEDKPGLILLSGSLIGLMKKLFKSSKEPLYGRIKKGIKLEPLSLGSCFELGRELKLAREDLIMVYCIFGGYPKYYVAMEDFGLQGKKAEEIMDSLLLVKDAPLEDEVNTILAQEFGGRSGIYYSILEAIANGNNTISTIASYLNTSPTSLTRQIKELRDHFELIEFEMPFRGKRGIYRIKHPLIQFWFSGIYKKYSDYVARKPEFIHNLKRNLNTVYGKAFERVATEFLTGKLGLTEAKRQWGKILNARKGENAYEIDLIGKSEKEVYAFELKWSDLGYNEALGILKELQTKAGYVPGLPEGMKFGMVARKIEGKQKLQSAGYAAYDLGDF